MLEFPNPNLGICIRNLMAPVDYCACSIARAIAEAGCSGAIAGAIGVFEWGGLGTREMQEFV